MKFIFFVVSILVFQAVCYGQVSNRMFEKFTKTFERHFLAPEEIIDESCASKALMLKIAVQNGKVSYITFSDSAPEPLKKKLKSIEDSLNTEVFVVWCDEKKSLSLDFIFPVFFINHDFPCDKYENPMTWIGRNLTLFNGEHATGNIFIGDPLLVWVPVIYRKNKN